MSTTLMHLKVLLPFRVFFENAKVSLIVAETPEGSFGIMPHRRDCVGALAPGILSFEIETRGESYLAIDEGILVKTGSEVLVCVRRALLGNDLSTLREAVEKEFIQIEAREQNVRAVLAKMESGFVRRFVEFQHD